MALSDLQTMLKNKQVGDGLTLARDTLSSQNASRLLSSVPGLDTLVIRDVALTSPENAILLTGKTAVLGFDDVELELQFADAKADDYAIEMRMELPNTLAIDAASLSLGELSLTLAADAPDNPVTGQIRGDVQIGSVKLPVAVTFPSAEGSWLVEGNFENVPLPGLVDLADLVGGADFVSILPDALQGGTGLAISDIQIMLSYERRTIDFVSIGITSPQTWELVKDKFVVRDLALKVDVIEPLNSANRRLNFEIDGVLGIAGVDVAITVTGPSADKEWSLLAAPQLSLRNMAELAGALGSADLTDSLPEGLRGLDGIQLDSFELRFNATTKRLSLVNFIVASTAPWVIVDDKVRAQDLRFEMSVANPTDSATRSITGAVGGTIVLGDTEVRLNAEFGEQVVLSGYIPEIRLTDLVEDLVGDALNLPDDMPDFVLAAVDLSFTPATGAFSLSAQSPTTWELPIGIDGISIGGISIKLNRTVNANGTKTTSGMIAGTFFIGTASFNAVYNFPGDFVLTADIPTFSLSPLVQELCGGSVVRDLPIPTSVLNFEIKDIHVLIAPQAKTFSLSASSALGKMELLVRHKVETGWGFAIGFMPPSTFKFSDLSDDLGSLDDLRFDGTVLVASTTADRDFALTTIKIPDDDAQIQRGLNFFAGLDAKGTGVYELTGLKTLNVYAAIGTDVTNMVIEAEISGDFEIAENVYFSEVKFRLQPAPSNFALTLLGVVRARLDNSDLRFIGAMSIQVAPTFAANFAATMEGVWNEPFDTKGVAIGNVALEVGLLLSSFPPLPSLGFAGSLKVGDFSGMMAVKFDADNPSQSMLAIAFNKLYLMDIIRTFCEPDMIKAIPPSITSTVMNIGFEGRTPDERGVDVYIVPQPTRIGELFFEKGFKVQGRLIFWGLSAYASLMIDYTTGTVLYAEVDPIDLDGIFKLTGANNEGKAHLALDLRRGKTPLVEISCGVELLGMRRDTFVKINDQGFEFMISSKIFDLFECTLIAKGGNLDDTTGIYVAVTMHNDLLAYLREKAIEYIQEAADTATKKLTEAQQAVAGAQTEVNSLNGDIADMRKTILGERERDTKKLKDAESAVQKAQAEVDTLNRQIDAMRNTVKGERDRDAQKLKDAEGAVQKAQTEVDSLNRQIDAMRKTIQGERERDTQKLKDAQAAVTKAQAEVDNLNRQIDAMRNTVKGERERDTKKVAEAQAAVSKAQGEVDSLNRQIDAMRNTVKGERERDTKRLSDARNAVSKAQGEVDSLNAKINSAKRDIDAHKRAMNEKQEWYDNSGIKKAYRWAELSAVLTERGLKITALYTEIGGLEAAKGIANTALEGAKQILRGLEAAANAVPIDADPRVVALLTAHGVATGALTVAQKTLQAAQAVVKSFPIDADPRVVGLLTGLGAATGALTVAQKTLQAAQAVVKSFPIDADPRILGLLTGLGAATGALTVAQKTLQGLQAVVKSFPIDADPRVVGLLTGLGAATGALTVAQKTLQAAQVVVKSFPIDADPRILGLQSGLGIATGALQAANLTLEGVKISVGEMADVAEFIADAGLGGIVDVRSAKFEAALSAAAGGMVAMAVSVSFMKQEPETFSLNFNFKDPLSAAESLAKSLLPG